MFFFVALLVLACICCVCCSCARTHGCLTNVFFLCVLDSTPLVVGLLYVGAVCLLFVGAIKWGLCVTTRGVCLEGLVGVVNAPPAVLSFLSSGCPELRSAASSPPPLPRHTGGSMQAHRRPTSRPLCRCHPPTAKASPPPTFVPHRWQQPGAQAADKSAAASLPPPQRQGVPPLAFLPRQRPFFHARPAHR